MFNNRKIAELESVIERLEERVWYLENPNKYKEGQVVKIRYESMWDGEIKTSGIITGKPSKRRDGRWIMVRFYPVINKNNKTMDVPEYGIEEVIGENPLHCIEED